VALVDPGVAEEFVAALGVAFTAFGVTEELVAVAVGVALKFVALGVKLEFATTLAALLAAALWAV